MDDKKIEKINKELIKLSLQFNNQSTKNKEMLLNAESFFEEQEEKFKTSYKSAMNIKYNVETFCKFIGIARSTIYKKNRDGISNYEPIIAYINMRSAELETIKKSIIKECINDYDFDLQLFNQLLTHEVEYQLIKKKLEEKNSEIKKLQNEIAFIKNQYFKEKNKENLN